MVITFREQLEQDLNSVHFSSPEGMPSSVADMLIEKGYVTIKKDLRNKDVEKILDTFKQLFGSSVATRYDRFAAHRLASTHGLQTVLDTLQVLSDHIDEKYCPTPSNVAQVESKWISIQKFIKGIERDNIQI